MKPSLWITVVAVLSFVNSVAAAELKGRVVSATANSFQVKVEGDLVPNTGDAVEVVLPIPEIDDVALIASGKVADVMGNDIAVTLVRSPGKIASGQLVRISSAAPRKRDEVAPIPKPKSTSSPNQPANMPDSVPAVRVGELLVLKAHDQPVHAVSFSTDGWQAWTCGEDARLWDLKSGKMVRHIPVKEAATSAAFSPDGNTLLVGGESGTVRMYDLESGREMHRMEGHRTRVYAIAFSPDGKRAATGAGRIDFPDFSNPPPQGNSAARPRLVDGSIHWWNLETGELIKSFAGHAAPVLSVTFSPNGLYIFSCSSDRTSRLWDTRTGKEVVRYVHDEPLAVLQARFSSDASHFLTISGGPAEVDELEPARSEVVVWNSGSGPGTAGATPNEDAFRFRLWNIQYGKVIREFRGHANEVLCTSFSPDGKRALSGSTDRTVRLWDVTKGTELMRFKGHEIAVIQCVFSSDNRRALTADESGTVRHWGLPIP